MTNSFLQVDDRFLQVDDRFFEIVKVFYVIKTRRKKCYYVYMKIGCVYKLVGNDMTYFGSTCSPLERRLASHLGNYRQYCNGNARFVTSFLIISTGNYSIHPVETVEFDDDNRIALFERERFHIDNTKCINKQIPGRSAIEYGRIFYRNNRIDILYRKKHERFDCGCGSRPSKNHRQVHFKTNKHVQYVSNQNAQNAQNAKNTTNIV